MNQNLCVVVAINLPLTAVPCPSLICLQHNCGLDVPIRDMVSGAIEALARYVRQQSPYGDLLALREYLQWTKDRQT